MRMGIFRSCLLIYPGILGLPQLVFEVLHLYFLLPFVGIRIAAYVMVPRDNNGPDTLRVQFVQRVDHHIMTRFFAVLGQVTGDEHQCRSVLQCRIHDGIPCLFAQVQHLPLRSHHIVQRLSGLYQ